MLNIIVKDPETEMGSWEEDILWDYKGFFEFWLEPKLKCTEFAKKVARDIDESTIISEYLTISDLLGDIRTTDLSGGVQCLIIANETDKILPLFYFGNNCFKYLFEIADRKDLTLVTDTFFRLFYFWVAEMGISFGITRDVLSLN